MPPISCSRPRRSPSTRGGLPQHREHCGESLGGPSCMGRCCAMHAHNPQAYCYARQIAHARTSTLRTTSYRGNASRGSQQHYMRTPGLRRKITAGRAHTSTSTTSIFRLPLKSIQARACTTCNDADRRGRACHVASHRCNDGSQAPRCTTAESETYNRHCPPPLAPPLLASPAKSGRQYFTNPAASEAHASEPRPVVFLHSPVSSAPA